MLSLRVLLQQYQQLVQCKQLHMSTSVHATSAPTTTAPSATAHLNNVCLIPSYVQYKEVA